MGMAASQARFLGLTARKTNVEYEGQQINQQRTALANQSANYYNDLLGMTVPTPPSVADFTKTVYTFQDGNLANSVSSLIAKPGGLYTISYTSSWTNDFAPVAAGNAIVTRDGDKFFIGATQLREIKDESLVYYLFDGLDPNMPVFGKIEDGKVVFRDEDDNIVTPGEGQTIRVISTDKYLQSLSAEQVVHLEAEEAQQKALLNEKYGTPNTEWFVRYVENTSTGTWSPMFYQKDVVENADYVNDTSVSNIPAYTMGSAQETEEIKGVEAKLEKDATGRFINITLNPGKPNEVTHALTTNTVTDQRAYDDAMNQYEYDKQKYEQSIEEINAKIEIIQAQDKNLELRLKQLDTEQDAISNEMEAVQKVIEKNVDSSFKTFG